MTFTHGTENQNLEFAGQTSCGLLLLITAIQADSSPVFGRMVIMAFLVDWSSIDVINRPVDY